VKPGGLPALAARWGLSSEQVRQLGVILEQLQSDEHAPTAIRDERAVDLHLADSLVALDVDEIRSAGSIADLGAGAGFPGVALAVALPGTELRLIESQRRECEFLERLCASAGLANAQVVRTRAEQWQEGLSRNEVVLARALAAQPVVLEYAAPLLQAGGTLVDWRGRRNPAEEDASAIAAEALGLRLLEVRRVAPFIAASDRHLHLFLKVRDTPERFPRRPGVARKRPIARAGTPASA
jgi:16S rRNA (guanine527-N7)-methyltransferase